MYYQPIKPASASVSAPRVTTQLPLSEERLSSPPSPPFLFFFPPRRLVVQSRVIRLPTQVHEFLSSIRKYTFELTVNGKLPTDEELGDKIGATVEKIQVWDGLR